MDRRRAGIIRLNHPQRWAQAVLGHMQVRGDMASRWQSRLRVLICDPQGLLRALGSWPHDTVVESLGDTDAPKVLPLLQKPADDLLVVPLHSAALTFSTACKDRGQRSPLHHICLSISVQCISGINPPPSHILSPGLPSDFWCSFWWSVPVMGWGDPGLTWHFLNVGPCHREVGH